MECKGRKATTMVFRKDNGWVFERCTGKYTIAFHRQYRTAAAATDAARTLFPDDLVEIQRSISRESVDLPVGVS